MEKWLTMALIKRCRSFWDIPFRGNMTWGWRKMLQLRPIIWQHVWYKIGDGSTVYTWFDHWDSLCPISKIVSPRDIHSAGFNLSFRISDSIQNGHWNWPLDWFTKYPMLSMINVPPQARCLPCHAFHLWLVIKRKLKTQDSLRQWDVWNHMKIYASLSKMSSSLYATIDYMIPMSKRRSARSIIARLVLAASSYFIWQERNLRLFKNQKRAANQIIECIKSTVRLKLLTCKFKKTRNMMAFMHLWKLPDSLIITGRRLADYAKSMNITFTFKMVMVSNMLDFNIDHQELDEHEKIAICAPFILSTLILKPNFLEHLMRIIRKINQCITLVTKIEANHVTPVIANRFTEALFFHSALFNSMSDCLANDDRHRKVSESVIYGQSICNIVAADGDERTLRHIGVDVWRPFFVCFGMVEIELSSDRLFEAKLFDGNFDCGKSCTVRVDGRCLLIDWKDVPVFSAWKFQICNSRSSSESARRWRRSRDVVATVDAFGCAAAEWFRWMSRNGLITTWDRFVESVKNRFGPSKYEDPQGALSKLLQLGTVEDYQREFEKLMNRVTDGVTVEVDLYVLPMQGPDVVLGIQWLQNLGKVSTSLPPHRSIDHRIHLLPDNKPVNVRPYRYPHYQKGEIGKLVNEMLSQVTIKDKFPIITVNEMFDELGGSRLVGYYRRFIKGYATLAALLTDLLWKDGFKWGVHEVTAFERLKQQLSTPPIVSLPNFKQVFMMEADASDTSIWAVLLQTNRLISYFSQEELVIAAFMSLSEPVVGLLVDLKKENKTLEELVALHHQINKGMRKLVDEYIKQCLVWQKTKYSTQAVGGYVQPLPTLSAAWEDVSIYFITGLPSCKGLTVILVIMAPRMRTQSAGRPAAESLGGGMGVRVGRGGRCRRPREGNDKRVDDLNGQGNDQGLGANGGVKGVNGNVKGANGGAPDFSTIIAQQLQNLLPSMLARVGNQGNVGNQNGNVVNENVQENVGNVLVNGNRVGGSYTEFLACNPKTGHAAYTDRFHELARLVPHLVTPESRKIESALTDEAVRNGSIKKVEKRGNVGDPSKDENGRDDNKRTRNGNCGKLEGGLNSLPLFNLRFMFVCKT
ncbi:reverse transcriptase domain-containing protein [Tanacetum coccineum]|uniref:Reverse transcriptase domain-containing protein n=1 Tax=Tanacetum coccineum TaxID=301880 RepID=A0ABQ4WWL6_9ASTR